jgi:nucleotide-binding universal stress UspA family protein
MVACMPIKKILVASDGSKHAKRALDMSLEIAEKFGGSIILLNVLPEPVIKDYRGILDEKEFEGSEELIEDRKLLLEGEVDRISNESKGVKIITKLAQGPVVDTIIATANSENVDLIALGHKGMHLTAELIMGSVTREVARKTEIPLLIVRAS